MTNDDPELTPREADTSNVGRCVRCGETLDMRDEGDGVVVLHHREPDEEEVDVMAMREGIAEAIRQIGPPEDEPLAIAYEGGEEIVLHEDCHDASALTEIYAENIPEYDAESGGLQ